MLGLGENTVSKYLHSFVFLLTEGLVLNTFNRNKGAVWCALAFFPMWHKCSAEVMHGARDAFATG